MFSSRVAEEDYALFAQSLQCLVCKSSVQVVELADEATGPTRAILALDDGPWVDCFHVRRSLRAPLSAAEVRARAAAVLAASFSAAVVRASVVGCPCALGPSCAAGDSSRPDDHSVSLPGHSARAIA